jgi:glutamate-1-semialdehyde 2,1-aminomutase
MSSLVDNLGHGEQEIHRTIAAVGEALEVYRAAVARGIEPYLEGGPVKPVFRRFS